MSESDDAAPYAVEPWSVTERELDLDRLEQSETVFALSNGHIGLRGNLDEGEPAGMPGTYLNAFYETRPLPYAEGGYGYPEDGQTIINVTDGKVIRLLVDDEPFDLRYGQLLLHERTLDLRDGVLRRTVEWRSPAGQAVRVRSTRLVSFVHRAVSSIVYEVEPLEAAARIVVQSELVANEPVAEEVGDPREAMNLGAALVPEAHGHRGLSAGLAHRTHDSGLRMVAGMDHVVDGPEGTVTETRTEDDLARVTVTTELAPGQTLRVDKLLAYGWSSQRTTPALRGQVEAALASARKTGCHGLARDQRSYLDSFWEHADVEIDGDDALQQAVRFATFHVLQAGARAEGRGIPAKGLTGRGYDGHSFWDMETYVLPVMTYVAPEAAAHALGWRHSTLDLAEARAKELGVDGATFPWRTIRGEECSGYWPASTAAFHNNAAVADAVRRYLGATEDEEFARGPGLDLAVATARLWRSVGHHNAQGGFRIDGVTGPDEYTALVDNNVYTNLMAARNLTLAAELAARHGEDAERLGVDADEIAAWRAAAASVVIPYDEELGVHPQSEGFTHLRRWDFENDCDYPLLLSAPYYSLYSSQVIKQADLVFALYLCSEFFSPEQRARDFAYYEQITVRDSSLSAAIQAIVAADTGHVDLAHEYWAETALIDLRDLAGNTDSGVHLAALAGAWLVAVAGFGGMRDHGAVLSFAPRLPKRLERLAFRLLYRGRQLRVAIHHDHARYELLDGEPIEILHEGSRIALAAGEARRCPTTPPPPVDGVTQPPGRAPARR